MGFSQVTSGTTDTADLKAPGAPGVGIEQTSNTGGVIEVTAPNFDADGGTLTGVVFGESIVLQADGDRAALLSADFTAARQIPGAQYQIFDLAPGGVFAGTFVIAPRDLGKPYSILARCADHARP